MSESIVSYCQKKIGFTVLCRKKINAREVAINVNPMMIKTPRLLSDVAALNNRIPPASPRNSVTTPWITRARASFCARIEPSELPLNVING